MKIKSDKLDLSKTAALEAQLNMQHTQAKTKLKME